MLQHAALIAGLERQARQAAARIASGTAPEVEGAPAWEEAATPDMLQQLAGVAEAQLEDHPAAAAAAQVWREAPTAAVRPPAGLPPAAPVQTAAQPGAATAAAAAQVTLEQPISVAPVVGAWATVAVGGAASAAAGITSAVAEAQAAVQQCSESAAQLGDLGQVMQAVVTPVITAMAQLVLATTAASSQQQNAIAALLATQGLSMPSAGRSSGSLSAAVQGAFGELEASGSCAAGASAAGTSQGAGNSSGGGGAVCSDGGGNAALPCNLPLRPHLLGSASRVSTVDGKGQAGMRRPRASQPACKPACRPTMS